MKETFEPTSDLILWSMKAVPAVGILVLMPLSRREDLRSVVEQVRVRSCALDFKFQGLLLVV